MLMALLFPVLILRFSQQLSHRDTWEFLIWASLFLAWIVIWPIALLRRLARIGLNRAWLLPILLPAAALAVALLRHWPHGLAVVLLNLTIAASVLLVFLSPRARAQPQ
ncbi:MAG: hypothetical protein WBE72_12510 [Terracidiphilus sp.]